MRTSCAAQAALAPHTLPVEAPETTYSYASSDATGGGSAGGGTATGGGPSPGPNWHFNGEFWYCHDPGNPNGDGSPENPYNGGTFSGPDDGQSIWGGSPNW